MVSIVFVLVAAVSAHAAPFLIQSPAQYTTGEVTHFAITTDGWQSFVTEAAYDCPIPNPPGYSCAAGQVLIHHDMAQYGTGSHNLELKAIRQNGQGYWESPSVPFAYGVGSLSLPVGLGLVAD